VRHRIKFKIKMIKTYNRLKMIFKFINKTKYKFRIYKVKKIENILKYKNILKYLNKINNFYKEYNHI